MILDSIHGASEAYSFARKLKLNAHTAITVVDSSLTNELDVMFTVDGLVDESAINDFAALHGELRIKKAWDQSGNGRHATQATWANMFRIHDGAQADKVNGRLAAYSNGRQCWLSTSGGVVVAAGSCTIGVVYKFETISDFTQAILDGEVTHNDTASWLGLGGASNVSLVGNVFKAATLNQRSLAYKPGIGAFRFDDDSSDVLTTPLAADMEGVTIGHLRDGFRGTAWEFEGHIQEVIRWDSFKVLSDIQSDFENFYFNLYDYDPQGYRCSRRGLLLKSVGI